MKHLTRVGWLMAAVVVTVATDTRAQNPLTSSSAATFVVNSSARLTITGSVSFPDSDPDLVNPIASVPVTVNVKARAAGGVQVLMYADQNLSSGTDTIAIDNLSWTCPDPGFTPLQSVSLTDRTLASFAGSGDYTGSLTFRLMNSWGYAVGTYSTTLHLTLTAP